MLILEIIIVTLKESLPLSFKRRISELLEFDTAFAETVGD